MNPEEKKEYVEKLVTSGNYLAAIICIKEFPDDLIKAEIIGNLTTRIIEEMNSYPMRRNQEKTLYLRSLLLWLFRDYPYLARIYKEQVSAAQQPPSLYNLLRGLQTLGTTPMSQQEVRENLEDTMDTIKQNIEDATESVKNGEIEDRINDFFYRAEDGIKKGLNQLSDFFQDMSKNTEAKKTEKNPEVTDKKDDSEPEKKKNTSS
ncbi:MAG: hypothetical protein JW969_12005 [Spirochaetales bacterium]|nr:hypothetical protein [Spirochaetales bacterium]